MKKKLQIYPDELDTIDYALTSFPKIKADFGKIYPDLNSMIKFKNDYIKQKDKK